MKEKEDCRRKKEGWIYGIIEKVTNIGSVNVSETSETTMKVSWIRVSTKDGAEIWIE